MEMLFQPITLGLILVLLFFSVLLFHFFRPNRQERLYRKHFPNPTSILPVMDPREWYDIDSLKRLLDTQTKEGIFTQDHEVPVSCFHVDLSLLVECGLIERQIVWSDIGGNLVLPGNRLPLIRDSSGIIICTFRNNLEDYPSHYEFRRTRKYVPEKRLREKTKSTPAQKKVAEAH